MSMCIDKCKAAETTSVQLKVLASTSGKINFLKKHKPKFGKKKQPSKVEGTYCGTTHEWDRNKCPVADHKCAEYNRYSHFKSM